MSNDQQPPIESGYVYVETEEETGYLLSILDSKEKPNWIAEKYLRPIPIDQIGFSEEKLKGAFMEGFSLGHTAGEVSNEYKPIECWIAYKAKIESLKSKQP